MLFEVTMTIKKQVGPHWEFRWEGVDMRSNTCNLKLEVGATGEDKLFDTIHDISEGTLTVTEFRQINESFVEKLKKQQAAKVQHEWEQSVIKPEPQMFHAITGSHMIPTYLN